MSVDMQEHINLNSCKAFSITVGEISISADMKYFQGKNHVSGNKINLQCFLRVCALS